MKTILMTSMLACAAFPAMADPLGRILKSDGPYIDLPEGVTINAAAPSLADIHMMADLDGNPNVTTQEEHQMIALLSSVLLTTPLHN